jgi:hypothetical protein
VAGRSEDATQAMQAILQRHTELSRQGEALRQILEAKGAVPCEIWGAYNDACLDYLTKSQAVFDQLAQRGIEVDQVVYADGQPVPDPDQPGYYKTLRVQAPLRPPAFGFTKDSCPGIAAFQGSTTGWVPVPITDDALGSVASTVWTSVASGAIFVLFGGTLPIGAVANDGSKIYKAVAIWLDDFNDSPLRLVQAFTDCVVKLTKSGMPADQATKQCSSTPAAVQQPAAKVVAAIKRLGVWPWVAFGTVVVIMVVARHRRARALYVEPEPEAEESEPEVAPEPEAPAEPAPEAASVEGFDDCCAFGWPARKTRRRRAPMLLGRYR